MKAIKKNLSDEVLNPTGRFMFCSECGSEYSANKGDYFQYSEDFEFKCCGKTMEICVRQTRIKKVEDRKK